MQVSTQYLTCTQSQSFYTFFCLSVFLIIHEEYCANILISSIIMEFLYFYFIFLFTTKVVNEQKIMGVRFTKKKNILFSSSHNFTLNEIFPFLCNYLWNVPAISELKLLQSKSYTFGKSLSYKG